MRTVFYVVRDSDRWKVEAGASDIGPFATRADAIQAAVAAAGQSARNARSTLIMAQIENPSTWEKIWAPDETAVAAK